MKILSIKWRNDPILGDLHLNCSDPSHSAYSTIVIAGENGIGKSTILERISNFLNLGSFSNFEYIEYMVNGKVLRAVPAVLNFKYDNFFDIQLEDGRKIEIRSDRANNLDQIDSNEEDLRRYGCVLSKARANYKTEKITYTKTSQLDADKYDGDNSDDFTSLKQLIVDVANRDNSSFARLNRDDPSKTVSWATFYKDSNIFRFREAFNSFFEELAFDDVIDMSDEKTIVFKKNGLTIPIDQLSTGEKQIVFRGAHLLRNSSMISSGAIFIDEPELSMHPKWQRKILEYYTKLFTSNGQQTAQLFFSTHSDHVVKAALKDPQALVITLEKKGNNLTARKNDEKSILPSVTSAEANYRAFDLPSIDFHIELYGHLQEKNSLHTVKDCDSFIVESPLYNPIIHSAPSRHGRTAYQTLSTKIRNAIHHPVQGVSFTEEELRLSIKLLIDLCASG